MDLLRYNERPRSLAALNDTDRGILVGGMRAEMRRKEAAVFSFRVWKWRVEVYPKNWRAS